MLDGCDLELGFLASLGLYSGPVVSDLALGILEPLLGCAAALLEDGPLPVSVALDAPEHRHGVARMHVGRHIFQLCNFAFRFNGKGHGAQ